MASNDYAFITHWRVPGTTEEVAAILGDALALPRWWPAVYLDAEELEPGDVRGVGRLVRLYTKGWLPYRLRWQFRVLEANPPHGFVIAAEGDFVGRGAWSFVQDGDVVDVVYDWRISAQKPLLQRLSFVLKPLFAANHRWAMARGEESLKLELARRRAGGDAADGPAPPGPTSARSLVLVTAAAALLALLGLRRLRRGT